MIELYPGLCVGDQSACTLGFDGFAVVHLTFRTLL
jgi:hypothetical protein